MLLLQNKHCHILRFGSIAAHIPKSKQVYEFTKPTLTYNHFYNIHCDCFKFTKKTSTNKLNLQQETFSTWCKDSKGNPRGHTFASVNCKSSCLRFNPLAFFISLIKSFHISPLVPYISHFNCSLPS